MPAYRCGAGSLNGAALGISGAGLHDRSVVHVMVAAALCNEGGWPVTVDVDTRLGRDLLVLDLSLQVGELFQKPEFRCPADRLLIVLQELSMLTPVESCRVLANTT